MFKLQLMKIAIAFTSPETNSSKVCTSVPNGQNTVTTTQQ